MDEIRTKRWRRVPRVLARLLPVYRDVERMGRQHGTFFLGPPLSYGVRIEFRVGDGLGYELFPNTGRIRKLRD